MIENLIFYVFIFFIGLLFGNFTTTILHRLPSKNIIKKKAHAFVTPPFCSKCHHSLKFYEYLPLLSWISTMGKCNYCSCIISKSYIKLEILCALNALLCFFLFGMSDLFILLLIFSTTCLLAAFLYWENDKPFSQITCAILVLGMLYKTMVERELSGWALQFSIACMISMYILNKFGSHNKKALTIVHIILPASICLFQNSFLPYLTLIGINHIYSFLARKLNVYSVKKYPIDILLLYLMVILQSV
jgi:leader peptidase (prepilin peptidase) / N-methyltransferase